MWRPCWINSKLTVMMVLVVGGRESGPMTQQGWKTESERENKVFPGYFTFIITKRRWKNRPRAGRGIIRPGHDPPRTSISGVTVEPEEAVLMEIERRNMSRQMAVYSTERAPVLCGNLFPHHNVLPLTDGNRDGSKPESFSPQWKSQ